MVRAMVGQPVACVRRDSLGGGGNVTTTQVVPGHRQGQRMSRSLAQPAGWRSRRPRHPDGASDPAGRGDEVVARARTDPDRGAGRLRRPARGRRTHPAQSGRPCTRHLQAAQGTAQDRKGDLLKQRLANSVHVERVMSHIDAAEAFILRSAPLAHVAAQVPAILNHVRNHLAKDNVPREQAEAIAQPCGNKAGPS